MIEAEFCNIANTLNPQTLEGNCNAVEVIQGVPGAIRETLLSISSPLAVALNRIQSVITSLKNGENPFSWMESVRSGVITESLIRNHEIGTFKDTLLTRCSQVLSVVDQATTFINQQLLEGSFPFIEELDPTGLLLGGVVGFHISLPLTIYMIKIGFKLIAGTHNWKDFLLRLGFSGSLTYFAWTGPMEIMATIGGTYPDLMGGIMLGLVGLDTALIVCSPFVIRFKAKAQKSLRG